MFINHLKILFLNKGEDMNIKRIDLTTTLVPFIIVIALCLFFMVFPTESSDILHKIKEVSNER